MYKTFIIILILMFYSLPSIVFAADCTIIYGGGEMSCPSSQSKTNQPEAPKPSPTPLTSQTTLIAPTNPSQTKGGLPLYDQTKAETTPATGPEALGLIGLIPVAAAGFYLRRKTS